MREIRGENSVLVRFIDYGPSEKKRREEMFFVPEMISRHPPAVMEFKLEGSFRASQEEVEHFIVGRKLSVVVRREGGSVEEVVHFFENGTKLDFVGRVENKSLPLTGPVTSLNMPEILREATAIPDLQLSREDFQLERRKRADESLGARRRSPLRPTMEVMEGMDVRVTRPKLISRPRPATPEGVSVCRPRLVSKPPLVEAKSSSWSIGDKVLAFWCGDNSWKRGVIHELDATAALVVFSEQNLRPTYTDLSLIKPDSLPLGVLSHLEQEVTNISRDLRLQLHTREEGKEEGVISASMTESQVLDCSVEDFATFARTGAGSRVLQSFVSPHNRKLCQVMVDNILSCEAGPVKMMTNARSCFLLQKIFDNLFILGENQRSKLTDLVLNNFSSLSVDRFGYHVVLAAVRRVGRDPEFSRILENKSLLFRLLKDPKGTFVAQALVEQPLAGSTVTFLVNSLLGHLVELSNHRDASFFIQTFIKHWAQSASVDFMVEDILRHIRAIIHHPQGVRTIQSLLQARPDYQTVNAVADWVVKNMEAVYNDNTAVFAAKQLISTISANLGRSKYSDNCCWRLLLDRLVYSLMVGTNSRGRNHFISASCTAPGNRLVMKLLKVCQHLNTSVKNKLYELITSHRTILAADNIGCSVLKAAKVFV